MRESFSKVDALKALTTPTDIHRAYQALPDVLTRNVFGHCNAICTERRASEVQALDRLRDYCGITADAEQQARAAHDLAFRWIPRLSPTK